MAQKQKDPSNRSKNGGWILLRIKWVLKKKNDNMIRLVPARIESGRNWSLFRDSWFGGFLGILGLEGEKTFFDAPAPSVRGS